MSYDGKPLQMGVIRENALDPSNPNEYIMKRVGKKKKRVVNRGFFNGDYFPRDITITRPILDAFNARVHRQLSSLFPDFELVEHDGKKYLQCGIMNWELPQSQITPEVETTTSVVEGQVQ
jgi:hypothetical protein